MCEDLLWKKCVVWLSSIGVISDDNPVLLPDATFEMFALLLRDGVLLCTLAAVLGKRAHHSLEQVVWSPNLSEFSCTWNINLFLYVCGEHFGIDNTDLFRAEDLFQLQQMHLVMRTLVVLSHNALVKDSFKHAEPIIASQFSNNDAAIYEVDIKSLYANIVPPTPKPEKIKSIEHHINELIKSEKKYVQRLEILYQQFMPHLRGVLSADMIDYLEIYEQLADKHKQLLNQFEEANTEPNVEHRVCMVLNNFRKENLHIYRELTWHRDLYNNPIVISDAGQALKHCDKESLEEWPGVLNYSHTRLGHYANVLNGLRNAIDKENTFKDLINKTCVLAEASCVLMEDVLLHSKFVSFAKRLQDHCTNLPFDTRLADYGSILCESTVTLIEDRQRRRCYAFLFQKLLLLSNWSGSSLTEFQQVRLVVLSDYLIYEPSLFRRTKICFEAKAGTNASTFRLEIKKDDIDTWKHAVNEINENTKLVKNKYNTHKFKLTALVELSNCGGCRDFHVGTNDNFKCAKCQMIVHKGCIQKAGQCVANYDLSLTVHNWFAGVLTRDEAEIVLKNRVVGTYMVRVRPFDNIKHLYAFSVKTGNGTKHVRIVQTENMTFGFENAAKECQSTYASISQLISFLEINYYQHCKSDLPMCLPVHEVYATVIQDFNSSDENKISLVKGETVIVLGKECDDSGWWRGKIKNNGRPGFFPKTFVADLRETDYNQIDMLLVKQNMESNKKKNIEINNRNMK